MIVSEKANAKINLALKVCGISGAYHELDSAMVTVDLFDRLLVRSRRDKKVTLKTHGLSLKQYETYAPENDNAFKAAKLYCEKTGSFGADITLYKNIPLSSGMGGSSTDAAAVLRAMERIYKKEADLTALANELGSDTAYLLKGGACRIRGRGEIIDYFNLKNEIWFSVAFASRGVDTGECFKTFDKLCGLSENSIAEVKNLNSKSADNRPIEALIESLERGEPDYSLIFNDLYPAAKSLNEEVESVLEAYKSLSPKAAAMTGSGSAVFAIFDTRELCDWATDKMKKLGFNAMTLKTSI